MASQPISHSDVPTAGATIQDEQPSETPLDAQTSAISIAEENTSQTLEESSPTIPPHSQPQPASAPTATATAISVSASTCGVCKANPPKYKCPRCYFPYCSVACNKIHRASHPPSPPKPTPTTPTTTTTTTIQPPPPPTQQHDPPANPFHALDSSAALRALFLKYPHLPTQLLEIHAATLPPRETIPASLTQGKRADGWTHDVGIRNGKAALRRAKKDRGVAGEAVREYAELIAHVVGEAATGDDDIRQQAAREDTRLIQQLLAEEQQRRR